MIELRWYQKRCSPLAFDYWRRNPKKNPIIAIPTGAGKSLIAADLIYESVKRWDIEVLVLSHRKEILTQNQSALMEYLSQKGLSRDIGLYSAGLGVKQKERITFAGIQSVYRNSELFKNVKLVIIDEAHLISPSDKGETMYQKFLNSLPSAKCIGLTATPYRLGSGYIVGEGHLFDEIIFDLTSKANFNRLVRERYLTKLISKKTECELNAEGTKIIGGDYSEKELAIKFDKYEITKAAIKEVIRTAGLSYHKWLIFAINIEHAEHIVEELNNHGIVAAPIHSKMEYDRKPFIEAYKQGRIQALVNVNILTTGIDVPDIDLIVLLRPTKSPVLYVQSVGRGLRVHPNKDHCLVLDFAKVIQTLGPINDVHIRKKKKGKKGGDPIVKICPECNAIHHPSVRICDAINELGYLCNHEFKFKVNISPESSDANIISQSGKFKYTVDDIVYKKHTKKNSPVSMKVTYRCGIKTFNEWICIEHSGWAKRIAEHWLTLRIGEIGGEIQKVDQALEVAPHFRKPTKIVVKEGDKYPEIVDYIF